MDIAARVRKIVAGQLGLDESAISPESRFIEDLNADSLDIAELVMKAEDEFNVSITDEAASKIRTFGGMVAFLENLRGNDNAAAVPA